MGNIHITSIRKQNGKKKATKNEVQKKHTVTLPHV